MLFGWFGNVWNNDNNSIRTTNRDKGNKVEKLEK